MTSVSGSFCSQCMFNLGSKNISSVEMQWGVLPFCVRGKAEAAAWFFVIILSLKGDVDCGSSLTLPLLISLFLFLGF